MDFIQEPSIRDIRIPSNSLKEIAERDISAISNIASHVLQKAQKHIYHVKFPNLLENWLAEAINQVKSDNLLAEIKRSPLGRFLISEYKADITLDHDKAVRCKFPTGIDDVPKFIFKLTGIVQLDKIYHEIIIYNPESNKKALISDLRDFLNDYPYLKDYQASSGQTLLFASAVSNFVEAAKTLVEEFQCSIDLPCGEFASTPLLQAGKLDNEEVFQFLVEKKADIKKPNLEGETAENFGLCNNLFGAKLSTVIINNDDEEKSEYQWQYRTDLKNFKAWLDFKKADSDKLQNEILKGQDERIHLSDCQIDIKEFQGISDSTQRPFEVRFIGLPASEMFCMKDKKKEQIHTAVKWQLFHEAFGIFTCSEQKSKEINKHFLAKDVTMELTFEFPKSLNGRRTNVEGNPEDFGVVVPGPYWIITLDFEKFIWYVKDFDLTGQIRWIPWIEKDLFKDAEVQAPKERSGKNSRKNSDADGEDDLGDSNPDDAQKFINNILKGETPESDREKREPERRIFEKKGKLIEELKDAFPDERMAQDKDDLIVYGPPKLQDQVDRMLTFVATKQPPPSEPSSPRKSLSNETLIIPKKGYIANKLQGLMIKGSLINIEQNGDDLKVSGTIDQLADINEAIELFSQSKEGSEEKVIKKCFDEASFLIEDLRKAFQGQSLEISEEGDNIVVAGTVAQLDEAAKEIDRLKQVLINEKRKINEYTISGKGFLAQKLNIQIHGGKIEAKDENGDLKLSCSKINYEWLVNFLPVLEKKYEDEQKMMEIQNKIQEMGNNIDQEFKLKLFSSDLFSSVFGHLNKLIVSTKEKVEINGNPIFRWPSLNFTNNNLMLEIYVEGASKTQANKIEEEVRTIAYCFDVIKNVQVFYKSEKEKCRDWLSKIWARIQLTGARRTLCQKYREVLGAEIKRLFQEHQENRENEIKNLMIETLRKTNINSEEFEFAMLTKFYAEDHPLEEVKKATVQVAKEFIQKMKEDAVNEIKFNGMKIAPEARTVLDKLIQEFRRDLDKMLESGKPAEVFELFYRVELLLNGFKLNLPIFKDLPDFFDKLKNNKFVLVKASTGSGKSTLIPPLLLAMGYGKVAVTQPRRLPCRMISKRVNDTFDKTVSGWAVSGKSKNASSKLTYLTDGLLKEIIMVMGEKPLPYDVIMLDEIHERGQNVDLCIALLSLKIKRPQEKFKLILCSATVDEKIMSKFNQIQKAIFDITIQNNKIIDADVDVAKLQPVYLAAELSKKLRGDQQLLCFLPSAAEVKKAMEIFNSKFKRPAYPLLANQQNSVQEQYLRDGHVFFSTTIAETSLTFKNLVAVIDSGLIRTPLFDSKDKVNVLQELEAPKSTAKQRRGRLGRTALPGTYYSATKIDDLKQEYPISELEKINLIDVYFNLLRSTKDNKKVLEILDAVPTSDSQSKNFKDKVKLAADELTQLGILNSGGTITNEGKKILDLPVRGQAKMAKAIYAALTKFGCGLDLIILSAVLLVVGQNISVLLDKLRSFVSKDGDFATVLNVMKAILQKRAQSFNKFNVLEACKEIGISSTISHLLQDCYDKYAQYEDQFNQSPYKKEAQLSNNWENIAKALLEGFYDHAFVNMKYFGGPDLYYVRLDGETSIKAILAFDSTMSAKRGTVNEYFILAKEINFVQYEDHREDAGTISFAGRLEKSWITHKVKRRYNVYEEEKVEPNFLAGNQHFKIADNKNHLMMEGQATQILEHESTLEKKLRINKEINLEAKIQALIDGTNDQLLKARYRENFDELKRDKGTIFKSVFWRWKNEHQLEINFHSQQGKIEVKNARLSQIKEIEKQIDKFVGWFKYCNLIKTDQSKIYPQTLDTTKLEYNDIRTRIERLTNPNKDRFELLEYAVGPKANRTSRMELVAWILINKFGCTLEGGFVRDWVVGGRSHFPPGTTLQMCPKEKKLAIVDETVSPKDLDIHLSSHAVFDLDNFRKQLAKYRMTVDVDKTDGWRYYMIFDKNAKTGAFTADLIEPFAYACHDMIDFDVNNLYVKSGFTSELGMRISLERVELIDSGQTESISLEKIIQNIQQKKFHVLRSARMVERIEKMKKRGWTEGPIKYSSVLPAGRPTAFTETLVEKDAGMFAYAKNLMTPLGATILKVICLSNPAFDKIYEGQRDLIKRVRNNQLNERVLFHGTSEDGAKGIAEGSFDNRYFKDGQWGYGAYFADNPIKSHGYAPANARGERVMFLCKVLLGKEQIMNQSRNGLYAPDKDYDSVRGTANRYTEYIVYRFGQAKPFAMVIYTK